MALCTNDAFSMHAEMNITYCFDLQFCSKPHALSESINARFPRIHNLIWWGRFDG